jgi:hypothetical protein
MSNIGHPAPGWLTGLENGVQERSVLPRTPCHSKESLSYQHAWRGGPSKEGLFCKPVSRPWPGAGDRGRQEQHPLCKLLLKTWGLLDCMINFL